MSRLMGITFISVVSFKRRLLLLWVAANARPRARACLCLRVPGQNGRSDLVTHHRSVTTQLPLAEVLDRRRDLVTQPPFGSATAQMLNQRLLTVRLPEL